MRHVRIGPLGWACLAVTTCALPANAYDMESDPLGKLVHAVCSGGRLGLPLEDFTDLKLDILKNIWEGCRQESVEDLSCYPYTLTKDGKSRVIYMPAAEPSDARYEPLTADCRGRVGRWPAWRDAKEDPDETYRMGAFYADNPRVNYRKRVLDKTKAAAGLRSATAFWKAGVMRNPCGQCRRIS